MKRYMAILLVLCFGIGIMTACQSSSVESTPRQQEEDTEQNLRPLGPGESNRGLSEKAELLAQEIYQNITYPEEILELNGRNVVINNAIIQAVDEERGYFITDNLLVFEYLRSFDAIVGHTISAAGILSYDLQAGGAGQDS